RQEMFRGRLVACHEVPARLGLVHDELRRRGLGAAWRVPAGAPDPALLRRVHAPRYLDFLRDAWRDWLALDPANEALDILPSVWPGRGLRHDVAPSNFSARVGLHAFDAGTPITAGTWEAALGSADTGLTAARTVFGGERMAFGLCRPPGHHAGADFYGGYCFLNNVAIAAQWLRDRGVQRVAILDVDYHHGNGTQEMFYSRNDVLFISIHADPAQEYPFFSGYADEIGSGAGEGYNVNIPLPWGTRWAEFATALAAASQRIHNFGADVLLVSFGADTYEKDPISRFLLGHDDFTRMGEAIGRLRLPTATLMEGGYAVDELGRNTVNFLKGLISGAS
ncbi:MAG TPA: histone deacetylase family protein, partial [Alphaproteobacteria bacterium]|nr:histone deacetylase family protein [Alphaproteobacteria bacterium]